MNNREHHSGEEENPNIDQMQLESAPVLSLPLIDHIAEGDSTHEITPELQAGSPVLSPDADSNSLTPTASFLSLEELQAQLTMYSADPEVEARATDSNKEKPDNFDLEIDELIRELKEGASDRSLYLA